MDQLKCVRNRFCTVFYFDMDKEHNNKKWHSGFRHSVLPLVCGVQNAKYMIGAKKRISFVETMAATSNTEALRVQPLNA